MAYNLTLGGSGPTLDDEEAQNPVAARAKAIAAPGSDPVASQAIDAQREPDVEDAFTQIRRAQDREDELQPARMRSAELGLEGQAADVAKKMPVQGKSGRKFRELTQPAKVDPSKQSSLTPESEWRGIFKSKPAVAAPKSPEQMNANAMDAVRTAKAARPQSALSPFFNAMRTVSGSKYASGPVTVTRGNEQTTSTAGKGVKVALAPKPAPPAVAKSTAPAVATPGILPAAPKIALAPSINPMTAALRAPKLPQIPGDVTTPVVTAGAAAIHARKPSRPVNPMPYVPGPMIRAEVDDSVTSGGYRYANGAEAFAKGNLSATGQAITTQLDRGLRRGAASFVAATRTSGFEDSPADKLLRKYADKRRAATVKTRNPILAKR